MIHPERIAHIVIKVRDLEKSRAFYTETLGMQVMKYVPEIKGVFLSFNGRDHHEVALFEIGKNAEGPKMSQVGMLHVAFRMRNEEDLRAAYQELKEKNVHVTFTVNHGVSKSVYFHDPDGNELEVYADNDIPELIGTMPNAYLGMEKLEFAPTDPSLREMLESMRQ